jgi:hypothetical protein
MRDPNAPAGTLSHRGPAVLIFSGVALLMAGPLIGFVGWWLVTRACNEDLRLIEEGRMDPSGFQWYAAARTILWITLVLTIVTTVGTALAVAMASLGP